MRQNTLEPGATRAIFSTSASQSTREEPDAKLEGARNVALLLDRVAERDPVGRGAGRQHLLDLHHRGRVEAGAHAGQEVEHLWGRIGLYGIEHPGIRQSFGKRSIIVAHDIEVEHHARSVITARTEEIADTIGHGGIPLRGWIRDLSETKGEAAIECVARAMETRSCDKQSQP